LLGKLSRRMSETMDGQLGYGFYAYDEQSTGGCKIIQRTLSALYGVSGSDGSARAILMSLSTVIVAINARFLKVRK